jgi:hypothetical protein
MAAWARSARDLPDVAWPCRGPARSPPAADMRPPAPPPPASTVELAALVSCLNRGTEPTRVWAEYSSQEPLEPSSVRSIQTAAVAGSAPLHSALQPKHTITDTTTTHEQVIRRAQLQVLLAGLFAGMTREADRSMKGL